MQAALARAGGAEAALGAALLTLVHHLHEPAEACPAPMADGLAHLSKGLPEPQPYGSRKALSKGKDTSGFDNMTPN